MKDTTMSEEDWRGEYGADDDYQRVPPSQADIMALMLNVCLLVQRQQAVIEELWLRVHGTAFQPTPEQKHTRMLADLSVRLLRDDVDDYQAGRMVEGQEIAPETGTPAPLPDDPEAYADIKQVAHHLGISIASIGRMIRDERFPTPTWLSPNRMAWKAGVIRGWSGYGMARARREKRTKRPRKSARRR